MTKPEKFATGQHEGLYARKRDQSRVAEGEGERETRLVELIVNCYTPLV